MRKTIPVLVGAICLALIAPDTAPAQYVPAPEEVATPEAIIASLYDTFQRKPGEHIDWDRFASFFVPGALMVPNVEQTDGAFRVMTVRDFSEWVESIFAEYSPIGSSLDHGLAEDEVHSVMERYGDIVQVMSTYERHAWDSDEIDGRGINGITLVQNGGRWWIVSIVWDEESGAGPVPSRYMR